MKFKNLQPNKKLILLYVLVSIIPFVLTISNIYFGRIAFWYDPARDFLLALQNLQKPTLIGQPSGLPGLFYGPYWIWTISLWTLVSKDPRIVSFLLLTIPYFTIFPFILYKISKKWGIFIFLSIWFLFILNFGSYANQIWNVHYGALFLLLTFYFLINPSEKNYKKNIDFGLLGVSAGLVANFHLSFGIPLIAGVFISIFVIHFTENQRKLLESYLTLAKKLILYMLGFLITFTPFFLFEIRHSFIQAKTFLTAITNSIVYNTATVGQTGMTENDILVSFFSKSVDFLGLPFNYLIFNLLFIAIIFTFLIKNIKLTLIDKRLVVGLVIISSVMLLSFIYNENPTWGYYFIGVEILFMLFAGLFLSKLSRGKYIIIFFLIISIINHREDLYSVIEKNNFTNSDLGTRAHISESIFNDSEKDFSYIAYSSAIYTYEFDYLFMWLDEKNMKNIDPNSDIKYVIIPKVNKEIAEDFINYKTPSNKFRLIKKWEIPDGTTIYKMVKK